jgi:predicted ATP-binding protein involved in virulence
METNDIMKIEKILVKQLFGFLNHQIELKEEGVTFIHGPNGCGKTTLLKMVTAFFSWQEVGTLFEINFDELTFIYDNKDEITVSKSFNRNENAETLSITLEKDSVQKEKFDISTEKAEKIPLDEIDDYIPFLKRFSSRVWMDRRNGERLSYAEVSKKFAIQLSHFEEPPLWLQDYQKSNKTFFIPAQHKHILI